MAAARSSASAPGYSAPATIAARLDSLKCRGFLQRFLSFFHKQIADSFFEEGLPRRAVDLLLCDEQVPLVGDGCRKMAAYRVGVIEDVMTLPDFMLVPWPWWVMPTVVLGLGMVLRLLVFPDPAERRRTVAAYGLTMPVAYLFFWALEEFILSR